MKTDDPAVDLSDVPIERLDSGVQRSYISKRPFSPVMSITVSPIC